MPRVRFPLHNNSRCLPQQTKDRVIQAAQALNYSPNFFARTLRLRRTYSIGVIAEEIGDAYGATVISGIEDYLRNHNYFFLTVIHRHDPKLLQTYAQMLLTRGVEGFITTDTSITEKPALPTVAVAGHERIEEVTNVILARRETCARTPQRSWASGDRIHQGTDTQFRFGGAMERHL